jgi:DNA-binding GntR family transcriptional regulator
MDDQFGPDDKIKHAHIVPPYRQLAAILRARIARGDYPTDAPIPSEVRLGQEFGVGRDTVRRAERLLADEGLLIIAHGRGVYVVEQPREH